MTCKDMPSATFLPGSGYGATRFDEQAGMTLDLFGQAPVPASPSVTLAPHGSKALALEAAAATSVPTLILSTSAADGDVAGAFGDGVARSVASTSPHDVVPEIIGWLGRRRTEDLPPQRW